MSNPDARTVPSPMGGGWAFPLTKRGRAALEEFFGAPPVPIEPHGNAEGYIVEPHQTQDAALHLDRLNLVWRVEQ